MGKVWLLVLAGLGVAGFSALSGKKFDWGIGLILAVVAIPVVIYAMLAILSFGLAILVAILEALGLKSKDMSDEEVIQWAGNEATDEEFAKLTPREVGGPNDDGSAHIYQAALKIRADRAGVPVHEYMLRIMEIRMQQ